VAGSAKDEVKQLMRFVEVGLTFEVEDKGGTSVNCQFIHSILCVLCVFGGVGKDGIVGGNRLRVPRATQFIFRCVAVA